MSTTERPAVPAGVDSPAGKLVYLAVAGAGDDSGAGAGGSTADDGGGAGGAGGGSDAATLGRRLDMKQVEVYSILGTLESRGLVERTDCGAYRVAE